MINFHERPGERRGFVHGTLLAAASGFIGGGPAGAALAVIARKKAKRLAVRRVSATKLGGGGSAMAPSLGLTDTRRRAITKAMVAATARGDVTSAAAFQRELGSQGRLGPAVGPSSFSLPCVWPARIDPLSGECKLFVGDVEGPDQPPDMSGRGEDGMRRMVAPVIEQRTIRSCPPGFILNRDNWCVWHLPRSSKARKWRPGRKPMFTGGQLNAIKTAGDLAEKAEDIFRDTNPAKKSVAKNYRANWRKPLKK